MPAMPSKVPSSSSHRNRKRALKRKHLVNEEGHKSKPRTLFEHVQLADEIEVTVNLKALPVAKGAYSARRSIGNKLELEKAYTPLELTSLGFTILEWDGRFAC
jgi:hypothetical protein